MPRTSTRRGPFLGTVLVAISTSGAFNTVLLETRQRWRELAVLDLIAATCWLSA